MATPLGFSVETLLPMNSNVCRSAGRSFGKHAHAGVADDDRSPGRTSVMATQRAVRSDRIDDDAAVHFLVGDFDPVPGQADLGPLVGGAVKAFGKGAVHVGRAPAGNLAARSARRRGRRSAPEISPSSSARSALDFDQRIARIVAGLADRDLA